MARAHGRARAITIKPLIIPVRIVAGTYEADHPIDAAERVSVASQKEKLFARNVG